MIVHRFFEFGRLSAVVVDRGGWGSDRFAVIDRYTGMTIYTRGTLYECRQDWYYNK